LLFQLNNFDEQELRCEIGVAVNVDVVDNGLGYVRIGVLNCGVEHLFGALDGRIDADSELVNNCVDGEWLFDDLMVLIG
jgi:hypothetical protein